jgi:hypothetical protein
VDSRGLDVWVGFGADLPAGTSISTEWGELRARRAEDSEVLRTAGIEYDPGRGCILQARVSDPWTTLPDGQLALQLSGIEDLRWKKAALGFLLAQNPSEARPVLPWFCLETLDGGGGGGSFGRFLKGKEFSEEEVVELDRWMGLVGASSLSAIAIDRATLMLNRLVDHADALIDGVIVWECLFGTGDVQELSYRVSMSMACVLSQVPAERVALQNEIKKFYNLRSKIVHGGRQLNSGEDKDCRDRVQELTLSALRALLERHPSLIGAKPDKFIAFVMGQQGDMEL